MSCNDKKSTLKGTVVCLTILFTLLLRKKKSFFLLKMSNNDAEINLLNLISNQPKKAF